VRVREAVAATFPFVGDFFFVATFAFFDAYDFVDAAFADAAFAAGRLVV